MNRYAIYYSPDPQSELARVADDWLGRDIFFAPCVYVKKEVTAPFHYGFHATIKPPFFLKEGKTVEQLEEAMNRFAMQRHAFMLPSLRLTRIGNFYCLSLVEGVPELNKLASDTVRFFDDFRRPAGQEELRRRRASGLTSRQDSLLLNWGYPYVMEEFRFHLTLTSSLQEKEMAVMKWELEKRFTETLLGPRPFSTLCLFEEEDRQPFVLRHCFALSAMS